MGLLNPTWLWGLAGLAIPVAIHLLSRKDMRVIFMSGYAEDAFRKQAEMDDDVHFLSKPFPLQELAAKVKDVMSAPA